MIPKAFLLAGVVLALGACAGSPPPPTAPRLQPIWTVEGLANPESMALSAGRTFLYVSNVDGEGAAKDANGFISSISVDGVVLDRTWAAGLDAPKGLALKDGRLFAADIDHLVEIDARSGAILARIPAPGAVFLNDVLALRDGTILISDSGGAKIFAVKGGQARVWAADPLLKSVNGLLLDGDDVIVSTMAGKLLRIPKAGQPILVLGEGLAQADGIARLSGGAWLVSSWPGELFFLAPGQAPQRIWDTRAEGRYLNDMTRVGDVVYIAHWNPSAFGAYRISPAPR